MHVGGSIRGAVVAIIAIVAATIFPLFRRILLIFLAAPVIGFIVGGMIWGISAIFFRSELNNFDVFLAFVIIATLVFEVIFINKFWYLNTKQ